MPRKAPQVCNHPGCNEVTHARYCDKHTREMSQRYNRYQRDRTAQTFYESSQWRNLRRMKLNDSPMCEECRRGGTLVKATMVDHIIPIRQGGEKLDLTNLQSLCHSCHSRKTMKENHGLAET